MRRRRTSSRTPLGAPRCDGSVWKRCTARVTSRPRTPDQNSNLLRGRHRRGPACPPASRMAQGGGGGAMPDFTIERRHRGLVCGVDESGRGPLAGPVVAAAVILDPRRLPKTLRDGLDDSKVLTPEQREVCYRALMRCVNRGTARIGVGAAGTREIDRI